MKRYLRVVQGEVLVEMTGPQLDIILHKFYHYLHERGMIQGDEACVECKDLVFDFVSAQEWIDKE